jgi:UDP-2-acetamido-2-deoxy-ribo-hexuluronate aminotransferase
MAMGEQSFQAMIHLHSKIKLFRSHGQSARYYHDVVGINGRIDTIQSAILRVKLRHLDKELENRQKAADLYTSLLGDIAMLPEISSNEKVPGLNIL